MNSTIACLGCIVVAGVTALVPGDPPADAPATDTGATESDALTVWRERAARAEAWLKAKASQAEQAASDALAKARAEVLGTDAPITKATVMIAGGKADQAETEPSTPVWTPIDSLLAIEGAAQDRPMVLLIHGLDEPGTIWDDLVPVLMDHGATVIRFDYPNDQPLVDSGRELVEALKALRARGVERVSIVAHSMGGLVSRDALTAEYGYGGNGAGTAELPAVDRLIMCGTPNHGAPLAALQAVAEAREQVVRRFQGTSPDGSGMLAFKGDGDGEAGRDLREGSEFLKALNARPNPRGVAMTTLCGVVTPAKACEFLKSEASEQWAGFLGSDSAAALTAQACAIVETLGDGVVPAASTRLEGVSDHVEFASDHRSMLKRWSLLVKLDELRGEPTPPAPAIPVILDRLGLEPLASEEPVDPSPRAE